MKLATTSLLLFLALTMTGCSWLQPEPEIITRTVTVAPDIPLKSAPRPITMTDVNWYVVTTDNIEEFEARFENENTDLVFFALSVPHYQNLSVNLSDIRRYIEQQQAIILYYETQITESRNLINTSTNTNPQEQSDE
jgi:hypothetical protein